MHLSVADALKQGWEIFKSQPWFFVGAGVILLIASFIVGMITGAIDSVILGDAPATPEAPDGTLLGSVVNLLLTTLINMGMIAFFLKSYDNLAATNYADLWHPQHYLQYFAVSVLLALAVGVGLILLIVPGLIALAVFLFAPFIVIDRGLGPIEAMKASMELTKGHRWQVFGLILAAVGINLAGILAFGVGLLVTIPVTTLAVVHAYRLLGGTAATPTQVDAAYA